MNKPTMTAQPRQVRKVYRGLQESKKRQGRIIMCAELWEARSENQGELPEAKAQLKCPQGHVRPTDARRKGTDIQSQGDSVFKSIHIWQRTTGAPFEGRRQWERRKRTEQSPGSVFSDDRGSSPCQDPGSKTPCETACAYLPKHTKGRLPACNTVTTSVSTQLIETWIKFSIFFTKEV